MCSILRKIVDIVQILGPILAILSLSITFAKLSTASHENDYEKLKKKIKNTITALVLLFLIPLFVNFILENTGGSISTCWKGGRLIGGGTSYKENKESSYYTKKTQTGEYETGSPEEAHCPVKNYKGNGQVKAQFTRSTMMIVQNHFNDFNYTSPKNTAEYFKKLGGVFTKMYGERQEVKTAKQFQEVAEYVFGLLVILGVDYYNGEADRPNRMYCKWGSSCISKDDLHLALNQRAQGLTSDITLPSGSYDAYYPGEVFYRQEGVQGNNNIDTYVLGTNMTMYCNLAVDLVYYKAGLMGHGEKFSGSADAKRIGKNTKVITKVNELYVGDIIEFFNGSIDRANPDTWNSWYHVAFVGEVDAVNRIITIYDGGSFLQNARNYKYTIDMDADPKDVLGGNWTAVRPFKIKEQVCDK